MTIEQILQLRNQGEATTAQFKERIIDKYDVDCELVAMSNTKGGLLDIVNIATCAVEKPQRGEKITGRGKTPAKDSRCISPERAAEIQLCWLAKLHQETNQETNQETKIEQDKSTFSHCWRQASSK